jgi:hypothetical protein
MWHFSAIPSHYSPLFQNAPKLIMEQWQAMLKKETSSLSNSDQSHLNWTLIQNPNQTPHLVGDIVPLLLNSAEAVLIWVAPHPVVAAWNTSLSPLPCCQSHALQAHLTPLTTCVDEYANKSLDVIESRYSYPFKTKPEEITTCVP